LSTYYLIAPETELSHGYCDFFLMPDRQRYPMVAHSYIVELKYLRPGGGDALSREQWQQAADQLRRYAQDAKVRLLADGTQLHLIAIQFRGDHAERMEEIE
ncbi:MAG: PD-(D/E)XK nuclease domain-containing protein, partial [Prevotella sp.]|nr:PD-(D/E)XK nuclease domain-containing protein [Prevotella sp.]